MDVVPVRERDLLLTSCNWYGAEEKNKNDKPETNLPLRTHCPHLPHR